MGFKKNKSLKNMPSKKNNRLYNIFMNLNLMIWKIRYKVCKKEYKNRIYILHLDFNLTQTLYWNLQKDS